jgi:histidinol-phosphatase (PHP family)
MERSCARATELGLPSIAFTEHVDRTRWVLPRQAAARAEESGRLGADGRFAPPSFDVEGYLACIDRCRTRFPDLQIVSGVELGEPHWFASETEALVSSGSFERVLGSLHSLDVDHDPWVVDFLYDEGAPSEFDAATIVRRYLEEVDRMIGASDLFAVLAHIDYPVRYWPADGPAFDPTQFEEEFRTVLRSLARSGRALEVNTRVPLRHEIVRWWYEEGGDAVSFGSDAHAPEVVAHGFADAAAMVEAQGFSAGRGPDDFWRRHR